VNSRSETEAFHAALGRALTVWATVEASVSELYVAITRPQFQMACRASFFAIPSFSTRLSMVNTAAGLTIEDVNVWKSWSRLKKKLDRNTKIRNDLVHLHMFRGVGWMGEPIPVWLARHPADLRSPTDQHQYTEKVILEHAGVFSDLNSEIQALIKALPGMPGDSINFGKLARYRHQSPDE
jgi:hypothetical protein